VLALELSGAPITSASCWRARAGHCARWRESLELPRSTAFQGGLGGAIGGTDLARKKPAKDAVCTTSVQQRISLDLHLFFLSKTS
jgi:hypothetical protein